MDLNKSSKPGWTDALQLSFTGLESLRGVAAFGIIFYHVGFSTWLTENNFVNHLYLMVDVFFVLSGFIISYKYKDRISGRVSLAKFAVLRFGRVYPLHLFTLLVFVGLTLAKYVANVWFNVPANHDAFEKNNLVTFFEHLFLLQSLGLFAAAFNAVSWSISAEFFAYLLFAFLVLIVNRLHWQRIWSLICLSVSMLSFYLLFKYNHGIFGADYEWSFLRGIAGFFLGAFAFEIYRSAIKVSRVTALSSYCTFGFAALMICFIATNREPIREFLFGWIALGLVLGVALLPKESTASRALNHRFLLSLGRNSYSIYMIHPFFFVLVGAALRVFVHPSIAIVAERSRMIIDKTAGTLLLMLIAGVILWSAQYTYLHIERRYRDKIRHWADLRFQT